MPVEDKKTWRLVMREIHQFPVDPTLINVSVINGVCYIGGRIRRLRNPETRGLDMKKVVNDMVEAIEKLPGIRDVVVDAFVET